MPHVELKYIFETEQELREHLAVETRAVAVPSAPEPEPVAAPSEPEPVAAPEPTRDDTDGDGMPYNADFHADPPSTTADGLWRAKRGKADEAKAARAAFKAGGGDITPPPAPEEPVTMPGAATLPDDAPEPIDLGRVIEKITGMIKRQAVSESDLAPMYAKHSGVTAEQSFGVFQTNETARANLFAALCEIEPEMR